MFVLSLANIIPSGHPSTFDPTLPLLDSSAPQPPSSSAYQRADGSLLSTLSPHQSAAVTALSPLSAELGTCTTLQQNWHTPNPQRLPHTNQSPFTNSREVHQPAAQRTLTFEDNHSASHQSDNLRESPLFLHLVAMSDAEFEAAWQSYFQLPHDARSKDQHLIFTLAQGRRYNARLSGLSQQNSMSPPQQTPTYRDAILVDGVSYKPNDACPRKDCTGTLRNCNAARGYQFLGCSRFKKNSADSCGIQIHRASSSRLAYVKGLSQQQPQQQAQPANPQQLPTIQSVRSIPPHPQSQPQPTAGQTPHEIVVIDSSSDQPESNSARDLSEYSACKCVGKDGLPSKTHYNSKGRSDTSSCLRWRWQCKCAKKSKTKPLANGSVCQNSLYVVLDRNKVKEATETITAQNVHQYYQQPYCVIPTEQHHNHPVQEAVQLEYEEVSETLQSQVKVLFDTGHKDAAAILLAL
jgi:hypothetical protein